MDSQVAALRRARRPGPRRRALVGVADPSRGTLVAVGFPLAAALAVVLTLALDGARLDVPVWALVPLLVAPCLAERFAVQFGPRSWYTAATPAIVLTGLLAGPLAGAAAGALSQAWPIDSVWRRRLADCGIGALQGVAAGLLGETDGASPGRALAVAASAAVAALGINTVLRALTLLERGTSPFLGTWRRGIWVDGLEAAVAIPLLATFLLTWEAGPGLVVASEAALVAVLLIVDRHRRAAAAALAAEQLNARRDQLTDAPNRRAFEEALAAEHARVVRGGQPAGLFMVDLDHFKSVNDRYGHDVGDVVLAAVVRRLTDGLRPSDLVARWGGEELTVLAPGIRSLRSAERFAERIRRLVGEVPFPTRSAAVVVTVSVGGTLLDGSVAPPVALRRADAALYEAKRARDTVVVGLAVRPALRLEPAS